jgi:hypothetical protein
LQKPTWYFAEKIVYFFIVHMQLLTVSALVMQLALGNVCLMSMAHAQMPQEMEMAYMNAPDADCEHCAHETPAETEEKSNCANGHCFIDALPTDQLGFEISPLSFSVALSHIPDALPSVVETVSHRPQSTAPPENIVLTKTIVLRC